MIVSAAPAFANEGGSQHIHHSDSNMATLMDRGIAGSETFRSLVAQLDAAPIQVLTKCDLSLPDSVSGRLNLVTSVQGVRYVQLAIRCTLSTRSVSFLAHELQHALEIANNPEIDDADSMESYYAEVGFPTYLVGSHRSFETDAAIMIQRRVYEELNVRSSGNRDTPTGRRLPAQ